MKNYPACKELTLMLQLQNRYCGSQLYHLAEVVLLNTHDMCFTQELIQKDVLSCGVVNLLSRSVRDLGRELIENIRLAHNYN